MVASMKMAAFWVVMLCSLIEVHQTTQCYNPEDSHLQINNFIIQLYFSVCHFQILQVLAIINLSAVTLKVCTTTMFINVDT
jgi:hypothetical protein